jgi:hypothetical protein
MPYTPTNWTSATEITSALLNKGEVGIQSATAVAETALAAATGSATGTPGIIAFDSFGSTDNARVTAMNEFHRLHGGSVLPAVAMPARVISISTPIKLFSGMKLIAYGSPVTQEFSRGCVLRWTGGSGTSMMIFPPEGQTNQSYPSDGSPRNGLMMGIQFDGTSSTNWMPKNDPASASATGKILWYFIFHGCAWKSWGSVWWGWGNGSQIIGQTHFQANTMPCINLAGSENVLFGNDCISFIDNSSAAAVQQPHFISRMDESNFGQVMITNRQQNWALTIAGGYNTNYSGILFDTQESDPAFGRAILITGGRSHLIRDCRFQGYMDNPAAAAGGETANRGFIHVTGGTEIIIDGNGFVTNGSSAPASTPMVYAASTVASGAIRVGLNRHQYTGNLRQASTGRITSIDPSMTVVTN